MNAFNVSIFLTLFATQTFAQGTLPGSAAMECEKSAADETAAIRCYDAELKTWDGQLNAAYASATQRAKDFEARTDLPAAARNTAKSLVAMQRSWINYRDELCNLKSAALASSSLSSVMARTQCLLQETARQTKILETAVQVEKAESR